MSNLMDLENVDQASMNSQEVTDYLNMWYDGKRIIEHRSVKRTIERLINQSVVVQSPMVNVESTDTMGRTRVTQVYVFSGEQGMKDCITVVAQLSPEHTAQIVDRWMELERQLVNQQPAIPKDFASALRLAADTYEQLTEAREENVKLEGENTKIVELNMASKHHATTKDDETAIRETSRMTGIGEKVLKTLLCEAGVFTQTSTSEPYTKFINEGYFARRYDAHSEKGYTPVWTSKGRLLTMYLHQMKMAGVELDLKLAKKMVRKRLLGHDVPAIRGPNSVLTLIG